MDSGRPRHGAFLAREAGLRIYEATCANLLGANSIDEFTKDKSATPSNAIAIHGGEGR
jgi:hypothetical protein